MSIQPSDFLDSAASYIAADISEVSIRNAVSRAYYAAFHCCADSFSENELPASNEPSKGMHKQYISQLTQCDAGSSPRSAGIKLQALHSRRIKADYKLDSIVTQRDAALQLDTCRDIFTICGSHTAAPSAATPEAETTEVTTQAEAQEQCQSARPNLVRIR